MTNVLMLGTAIAIATMTAAIAAASPTITLSADGRTYHLQHTASSYTPPLAHKRNLPAIYANFATHYPKGLYNATNGAGLSGPGTLSGQVWLAEAFTPTVGATVREIDVAAGYIRGTKNVVVIHIYADSAGLPGTELWSHKIALPPFGACCAVVTLRDKLAITLQGATQYWVGITTTPGGQHTVASWNLGVLDQVDPAISAEDTGSGWQASVHQPQLAFGVYGK